MHAVDPVNSLSYFIQSINRRSLLFVLRVFHTLRKTCERMLIEVTYRMSRYFLATMTMIAHIPVVYLILI